MNRRDFLRMMGATGALIAVPEFVLAAPGIIVPNKPIELGTIRELAMYEINRDSFIFRLDAFNAKKKEQFYVDFRIDRSASFKKQYSEAHKEAQIVLRNRIEFEGWNIRDMVALPTPNDYSPPMFPRN